MAGWQPLRKREFVRKLRALDFDGPYSGTRHQFMVWGERRQTIPSNPEYSVPQLRMLAAQGVDEEVVRVALLVTAQPMEMLARAGAFDVLDPNRARVFEGLDALVAYSAATQEARNSSQVSLFGEAGADLPEPRLMGRDD